ncbi:VIT domain-containing protein [Calditrichota bacterium GD2]
MMDVDSSIRVEVEGIFKDSLALKALTYRGKIDGPIGRFSLQQHFTNMSILPLEVVYTFPINSNMLIDEFHIFLNGKSIHSQILPLDEAQKRYDDAVIEGDSATYIQQHRSNIFTLNIGNLAPKDDLIIQIKLLQLLSIEGKTIRLTLPTVVGPRYIPGHPIGERSGFGWAEPTDRVPDADWITPPVSFDGVPYLVDFQIDVSQNLKVESVESPSHQLRFFPSAEGFKITSLGNVAPDRDFVLNLKLAELPTNFLWKTKFDSKNIFLSWLSVPEVEEAEHLPTDYFFLIDRSGSMASTKLEVVKKAVRLCFRKFMPEDRFALAAFDHNFIFWKNDWQQVSNKNITEAEWWLKKINANGGTELLPALQKFFSMNFNPERRVVLVLLTDGEVGDEAEIADLVDQAPENLKVLLFGIDTAVNQELFEAIIEKTPGMVEYIYPGEPMEQKINLQFERIEFPLIKNVMVNEKTAIVFPDKSNLLHPSDLQPVLVSIDGKMDEPLTVSIQLRDGQEHKITPTILNCDEEMSKALNKFYAQFLIKKELRKINNFEVMNNPRNEKRIKEKIIKLAIKHQLQTDLTAWFAIAEREEKIEGMPDIQVVPSALPDTWTAHAIASPTMDGIPSSWYRRYKRRVSSKFETKRKHKHCNGEPFVLHHEILDKLFHKRGSKDRFFSDNKISDKLYHKLLLIQRIDDGALIPDGLKNESPVRATLLTLLALVNEFARNQKEALAYRSNFFRALMFILNRQNELSMTDKVILKFVVDRLHSLNIHLKKKLEEKFNNIMAHYDDRLNGYLDELTKVKLSDDSEKSWEEFIRKVNMFNNKSIK